MPALNSDDSADEYGVVQNDDDIEFPSIVSNGTTDDSDWQENWMFKKKKVQNDITTSSIGMLVPSPMVEVRALIGDRTADEVSDLSEAGSEIEDDESDLTGDDDDNDAENTRSGHDLPHILVESKTIIGGKNEVKSFAESGKSVAELLQPDSLVSEHSLRGNSPVIMEAKNEMIFMDYNEQTTNREETREEDNMMRLQDDRLLGDNLRESSTDELTKIEKDGASNILIDIGGNLPVPAPRFEK